MNVVINANEKLGVLPRHQQGQFAEHLGRCIYGGVYVGEDSAIPNIEGMRTDVIDALKAIRVPNLRWPGGCFADEYHWRDGVGPKSERPTMINNIWGGVTENNHFGTHEFLRFCELIGAEPYINGSVGTGTVREMAEWVEYLNTTNVSPMASLRKANDRDEPWGVKFWGVGNEPWGGNWHTAEAYADTYLRYNTFLRNHGGTELFRIAAGSNGTDLHWTDMLMRRCKGQMNGLSLHYYTIPGPEWNHKGSAIEFDAPEYFTTMRKAQEIELWIQRHAWIMERHDPEHKVAMVLDEWGTWFDVEPGTNPGFLYQQNTMRDALVAGLSLNVFHRYNRRLAVANIAQLVNVLQAMILTDHDKMLLTPTYHVFELYKGHQDAERIGVYADLPAWTANGHTIPSASVSASRKDGRILLTACNLHDTEPLSLDTTLWGVVAKTVSGRVLDDGGRGDARARNTFDQPNTVHPRTLAVTLDNGRVRCTLPPVSVAAIEIA